MYTTRPTTTATTTTPTATLSLAGATGLEAPAGALLVHSQVPLFLRLVESNREQARELIQHLDTSDAGLRLDPDTRRAWQAYCRRISSGSSLRDTPVPLGQNKVSIPLPPLATDMQAARRDEAHLKSYTQDLWNAARALVRSECESLSARHEAFAAIDGEHPVLTPMIITALEVNRRASDPMPPTDLRIGHHLKTLRELGEKMTRLQEVYNQLREAHSRLTCVAPGTPLRQLTELLRQIEKCALKCQLSDCTHLLEKFNRRLSTRDFEA